MSRYDMHAIERRWRERWAATAIDQIDLDQARRPFYNLMEFPYPSGAGLHVGHVYTYCGADTFGRLRRMQGYDVFQPIGFDAFGIHSENYALKIGQHPAEVVPANIRRFRTEQLERLGCQFDWSRVVDTTQPEYYRWTQWIFVQLFKAGLAYRAEAAVNWCPTDHTVLANEQVIDGRCERCDTPIEQRQMRQWFFRITAYADRLLDFSAVDFPDAAIKRQTAWIGRSAGTAIRFQVAGETSRYATPNSHSLISVFTTRPDTLPGATAIVLAPEHQLVDQMTTLEQRAVVAAYVAQAGRRLERERLVDQPKTGVFTGSYAIHPISEQPLPIWIADYVLPRYGTGAIMAVPAHDERDYQFAIEHGLPIEPRGAGERGRATADQLDPSQPTADTRYLTPITTYRLRDWLISRQRYWGPPIPIVYCERCGTVATPEDQLPVLLPPLDQIRPTGTSPLAAIPAFVHTTCPQCGGAARRETDVSDNFLDSAWYFLRYTSTEFNDRPWDAERVARWLPVDQYAGGPEHTTMHHLYARFICKALHDLGHLPFDEPFKRLRLHGMITKDGAKMSKSRGNVISPDNYIEQYGADVFRMYMLFLGPWEDGGDWSDSGISGVARFARRVYDLVEGQRSKVKGQHTVDLTFDPRPSTFEQVFERKRNQTIARVTEGIEKLHLHVAIAALMRWIGELREAADQIDQAQWHQAIQTTVLLLAPFAPHLAEDLWERLGGAYSVHGQPWPVADPTMLQADLIELPVQIDGKVRDHITVAADATEPIIQQTALASERVQAVLHGATPRRVVVVAGRVVNIVR